MGYFPGDERANTLRGTYVSDSIYGFGGNDILRGLFGSDYIYGGAGDDRIYGDAENDWLEGNEGADSLMGGSGSDTLDGGADADVLSGGGGNDTFHARGGEISGDRVYGGSGRDTLNVDYWGLGTAVRFSAADPLQSVTLRGMSVRGIERYDFDGGDAGDRFTGWLYNDDLDGNGGADILSGGYGDDYLYGGDGDDTLNGGGDDDSLQGEAGDDRLEGSLGDDGLSGGDGDDTLSGGLGDDDLWGGSGRDVLTGSRGDDTLESHTGSSDDGTEIDRLDGGLGDDTVGIGARDVALGGAGIDTLRLYFTTSARAESWVFSDGRKTFANGAVAEGFEALDFRGGTGVDRITGGLRADTLQGGGGDDALNGVGGDDSLDGGAGDDVLNGGAGNDVLWHSSGDDTLYGSLGNDDFRIDFDRAADLPYEVEVDGGRGRDTVYFTAYDLSVVLDLVRQGRNDGLAYGKTFTGIERFVGTSTGDAMRGNALDDDFDGGGGDDVLSGGSGDDRLAGGGGSDTLTGGAGRDIFDFTDFDDDWRLEEITDFTRGEDRIAFDLTDLGFASAREVRIYNGADPTAPAGGPALLFETDTGRLWLDPDGGGSTEGPGLLATLDGVRGLAVSDLLLT